MRFASPILPASYTMRWETTRFTVAIKRDIVAFSPASGHSQNSIDELRKVMLANFA